MIVERYDLHVHTEVSSDADTPIRSMEAHALARGVTGLAVTDHDSIDGALRLRDRCKTLRVIIGEEVTTRDGDLIGLFLHERIPPKMSAADTAHAIHAQGGLVYLPHPFDKARARKSGGASLDSVIMLVDVVEVFNGKVGRDHFNTLAARYAEGKDKIGAGGSDSHYLASVGSVYNEIRFETAWNTPAEFLALLADGTLCGTRRSPVGGWLVRGRRPFSIAWRRLSSSEPPR